MRKQDRAVERCGEGREGACRIADESGAGQSFNESPHLKLLCAL